MAWVARGTAQSEAEVIRLETLEGANTPARVGANLRHLADSPLWTPSSGDENAVLRRTSTGECAWCTGVWSDGSYLGLGGSVSLLPASGRLRLASAETGTGKTYEGSAAVWLKFTATAQEDSVTFGSGWARAFLEALIEVGVKINSTQVVSFSAGRMTIESGNALRISGATVETSTQTQERHAHSYTIVDDGTDVAAVAVATYTVPENTAATLKCVVRAEVNATNVPYYWTEFSLRVYRLDGNAIEAGTAKDPDVYADPAGADVTCTYTCGASGVVTVYAQNTSGTVMIKSGEITGAEADLLGAA
jgi:hypothetical protein